MGAYWTSFVALGQIVAVCAVLTGSLFYQFKLGELPCPLCVLQRLAFLLVCIGPILIIRTKDEQLQGRQSFDARCFALTIIASLVGAAVSVRQILLHIVPPDKGYGPPILELHLYTWALVVFLCLIISSAAGVMALSDKRRAFPAWIEKGVLLWILVIAIVIASATATMEGFHILLPDDPARYELLRQIGISR